MPGLIPAPFDDTAIENAISSLQNNLALMAFRQAVLNSVAGVQKFEDGFSDEFGDESGVDTGSSSDQLYDSSNDLYRTAAGSDECSGGTAIENGHAGGQVAANAFDDDDTVSYWASAESGGACVGTSYIGYQFASAK